jgi:hypothetical protein
MNFNRKSEKCTPAGQGHDRLGTETAEELRLDGNNHVAWLRCFILKAIPTPLACDGFIQDCDKLQRMTVAFGSNASHPKAVRRDGRATILLPEDKHPTTAALLEMLARRFLRSVGEKREDGSVSPLHA